MLRSSDTTARVARHPLAYTARIACRNVCRALPQSQQACSCQHALRTTTYTCCWQRHRELPQQVRPTDSPCQHAPTSACGSSRCVCRLRCHPSSGQPCKSLAQGFCWWCSSSCLHTSSPSESRVCTSSTGCTDIAAATQARSACRKPQDTTPSCSSHGCCWQPAVEKQQEGMNGL